MPAGAASIRHRLGKCEGNEAGAKQDKTSNSHSEETVRSEFITRGTPPIVRPCSNRTTARSHSQKDSLPGPISTVVGVLMQHHFESELDRTALPRAISVKCMGQENADTQEGQRRCYDLDHRRIPRVATMPKRAALRKWR
jgi:hypothetical protein